MTPDQINRIIHEKVMGECWHKLGEYLPHRYAYNCLKCHKEVDEDERLPDYSQWQHYGPMLEVAVTKDWWPDFISEYGIKDTNFKLVRCFLNDKYLNPLCGSTAIAEFLEERRKNEG